MTFAESDLEGMDATGAEAYARAAWDSDPEIRAEFASFEACSAYARAIARGSVRRLAS